MCKRVKNKEADDECMNVVTHIKDVKIKFCNIIQELSFDERYSIITEYLEAQKVSDRIEKFLISLIN